MDFSYFATTAQDVENTSGNAITAHVTDLFEQANQSDDTHNSDICGEVNSLYVACNLIRGEIFPEWVQVNLGIGPSRCYEAVARAASEDITADDIESKVAETGDIGIVAERLSFGEQTGLDAFAIDPDEPEYSDLSIVDVYKEFEEIAQLSGSGSQEERVSRLFGLLNDCSPVEAKYVTRIAVNEMRIGAGTGAVRDGIVGAFGVQKSLVETAVQLCTDYGKVANIAAQGGDSGLEVVDMEIGRPIGSMKAQKSTILDTFADWDDAVIEAKYDGGRAQIHYDGDEVTIFSHKLEDITQSFPELVERVEEHAEPPIVLDGEIIPVDEDGSPAAQQDIMRRFRRQKNIEQMMEKIPAEFHVFDCLFVDGETLIDRPTTERFEILQTRYSGRVADHQVIDSSEDANRFEKRVLQEGHEGIMLKDPDAVYSPGDRGKEWRKIKPDVETLDLTITAAEWGKGDRGGQMGSFMLSAWDSEDDEWVPVGKVGTGITDADVRMLTERLEPHIKSEDGMDISLESSVVVEVGYEEILSSTTYASGFALRFPRFLGIREDKAVDDAESVERVARLYEIQ